MEVSRPVGFARLGAFAAAIAASSFLIGSQTAAGAFVYVPNLNEGTVSQYGLGMGAVLVSLAPPTVAAEAHPDAVAISPDGRSVYVANLQSKSVSEYSVGPSGALVPKSPPTVGAGENPAAIAISPDGTSVYVANSHEKTVSQYSVGPGGVLSPKAPATVSAGEFPDGIAVSPDGKSVYVSNGSSVAGSVLQFDVGPGGTLSPKSGGAPVAAGSEPAGIVVSPDGQSAYVANYGTGNVSQYTVGPGGVLAPKSPPSIGAGAGADALAISPDGKSVYVADDNTEVISQYDVGPGEVLSAKSPATVAAVLGPTGVAISASGGSVYVSNSKSGSEPAAVTQYNVGAGGVLSPKTPPLVETGTYADAIAITPDQGPLASFTASAAPAGSPSSFDGAASSDPDGTVARYDWTFGDGTGAANAGPMPTHTYAAPGTYTVTLQVTDNEGCSASELFTGQTAYCNPSSGAVTSRTVPVPAVSLPVASLPPPKIAGVHQSAATWREGSALAQISKRRKKRPSVGTTFSFVLNETATVSFQFTQARQGRVVRKKCVAKTRKNARRRPCKLISTPGTLSFTGHPGTNKVAFQGRVSRSKKLQPGGYTLTIIAVNSAGMHSTPASLKFTIVK